MCSRTKISYGCGHVYRSTSECHSSNCYGIHKHYDVKEGACRECRQETTNLTRVGEDKFRCIPKRSKTRDRTPQSSAETFSYDEYDVSGGASPWASQKNAGKTSWDSPHRKRADEAWLSEHEGRILDLSERMEQTRISERQSKPKRPKDLVYVSEDHDYEEYPDESDYVQWTPSKKQLHANVRRHLEDTIENPRSHRHQDRQYSHDSLPDSMPSYRSSPKIRKLTRPNVSNTYPEMTHEYDYYSSHAQSKHGRRHHQGHNRSRSDIYHPRSKSYGYELDYDKAPIQQLQMPPPTVYDTYDFYTPNASPSGVPFAYSEYPVEIGHPSPLRPQHYVPYNSY